MNAEKYYQSTLQNHLENIKESKNFYSWTVNWVFKAEYTNIP